jgi:uncharacterized protein YdaU (DUF1376 family)
MANAWSPFYWRDYVADTGHLTLEQHGAYLLLMAHYYMTSRPLPANASVLHRVCRCTTDADRTTIEQVLREFFVLDGEVYRHRRIDKELVKAADISEKRRAAANAKHEKARANASAIAPTNAVHVHAQPQPQPHSQLRTSKASARPTLEDVTTYCLERDNGVDPQQFVDHYSANGWKVGRNPMRDWRAAVRTWERREKHEQTTTGSKHERRTNRNRTAILAGLGISQDARPGRPDHSHRSAAGGDTVLVGDLPK